MMIEIITIGDELLIGQVMDTNSGWMANELTQHGFEVIAISTVGDNTNGIIRSIDTAFERADILLLSGGVGPTDDDVTKHTLCQYFHTALEFNDEVLQNIESIFLKRNIPLNQLTKKQAYVPSNCTVIQNKEGTAPILWFDKDDKVLISMPGVPFEMKTAMSEDVLPKLKEQFQVKEYLKRSCIVTDITESDLATELADFELQLPAGFSLAYLPSLGYIRLRLSVWGEEYISEIESQANILKDKLGDKYVSEGDKMPEEILGDILRKKKLTISTAESCTGGHIAHKLTIVPGASAYFVGSIVAYTNSIKEEWLNVKKSILETKGAVSEEVAEQMVINVAKTLGTDCSIAVSGIMGPVGGTKEKPVGTVWISTMHKGEITSRKYHVGRARRQNIERTANLAILQLLKMITKSQLS